MLQVRDGVFETNSSSTHSIVIPKKTNKTAQHIDFYVGEYGWENRVVYDTPSYLYTAILYTSSTIDRDEWLDKLKDILNAHGISYTFHGPKHNDNDEYDFEEGYIDHGYELHDFINALFDDEEMLIRYLVDGVVYTGNDNDEGHPDGCDIADDGYWCYKYVDDNLVEEWKPNPYHDEEHYDYFYKGN